MIFIVNQVYIFFYAILGGAILALLYDVLRIKRRAIKTNVIIVNLEDIFYWIVAAMFLFMTVYKSNSGEMRGYIFLGNVIGVILYETLLSKIIINSSVMIINLIKRILLFIYKILSFPFKLIYKILKVPIHFILRCFFKLLKIFLNKGKGISNRASSFTKDKIKRIPSVRKKISKIRKVRKST